MEQAWGAEAVGNLSRPGNQEKLIKQTAARQQATLEQGPASPTGASRGLGEQTGQLELIQHINKFILGSNLHSVPGTSGTRDYARG